MTPRGVRQNIKTLKQEKKSKSNGSGCKENETNSPGEINKVKHTRSSPQPTDVAQVNKGSTYYNNQIDEPILGELNSSNIRTETHRNYLAKIRGIAECSLCMYISGILGLPLLNGGTYVELMQCIETVVSSTERNMETLNMSNRYQIYMLTAKRLFKRFPLANAFKGMSNFEYSDVLTEPEVIDIFKIINGSDGIIYNNQIKSLLFLLTELNRLYIFLGFSYQVFIAELKKIEKFSKTRTSCFQMNVVTAEYFEIAMRESVRIQVQLTFTHIHTVDNRIPTAVPIYIHSFIYRKDQLR